MQNINRYDGDNNGGLVKFYFTAAEHVVRIPEPVAGKITTDIEMAPGTTWYAFYATRGSLQYREPGQADRAGTRYRMELKGYIAKDTPELSAALADLAPPRKFVLLYRDQNGFLKLVGSPEYYLTFERELDTGTDPSNRNGFAFSFKGDNIAPAAFYEGAFTVHEVGEIAPPPPPEQVVIIRRGDGQEVARLLPGQTFEIISGFSWGFRII